MRRAVAGGKGCRLAITFGWLKATAGGYVLGVDLLDVLRRQASRLMCPACGVSLADCRLEWLSQSGEDSLVRVTCIHCSAERLVGVTQAVPALAGPSVRDQQVDPKLPPISADEVLDVRLALRAHAGDLLGIFNQTGQ